MLCWCGFAIGICHEVAKLNVFLFFLFGLTLWLGQSLWLSWEVTLFIRYYLGEYLRKRVSLG